MMLVNDSGQEFFLSSVGLSPCLNNEITLKKRAHIRAGVEVGRK